MPYFMWVSNSWQKAKKSLFEHFCGQNVVTKQVYNDKSPGTQRQFVAKFRGLLVWHFWQSAERDKFESAYTYYITLRRVHHERIADFTPARFVRGVGFALLDDAVGCVLQQGNSSNHVYPQKIFHKSGKKYSTKIV